VDVAAGAERTLPPGVYGDVDVGGAASRHGRLVLTGGRYVFCSLRTRRGSVLEADSAAQVFVAGAWTLVTVFLGRVVGDFKWFGLFKRMRGTAFAWWDTWLFVPLCLLLALGCLVAALSQR